MQYKLDLQYFAAKLFEVDDVLPATTMLNITSEISNWSRDNTIIKTTGDYLLIEGYTEDSNDTYIEIKINGVREYTYDGSDYEDDIDIIIDTSSWTNGQRTVISSSGPSVSNVFWEDIEPKVFNITFEENGGTSVTDLTEQTALPNPLPTTTKAGYTFVAWYTDSALTTRAVAGATISANTTLYAKWHNLGSLFTEIAGAIRDKEGTIANIKDVEFPDRIEALPSHVELTQAQYDALATKDSNTYYLIIEES